MRICIDSNQFIFGIGGTDPASESLLLLLPRLNIVLPQLVINEVTRNLTETQTRMFFALLTNAPQVTIVDAPVPVPLVRKYIALGLREKADAFIGAFVEWQGAQYLISDNRHFLLELTGAAFEVLRPEVFLERYAHDALL
jgi:hypothetical protein